MKLKQRCYLSEGVVLKRGEIKQVLIVVIWLMQILILYQIFMTNNTNICIGIIEEKTCYNQSKLNFSHTNFVGNVQKPWYYGITRADSIVPPTPFGRIFLFSKTTFIFQLAHCIRDYL